MTGATLPLLAAPPAEGSAIMLGEALALRDSLPPVGAERDAAWLLTREQRLYLYGRDSAFPDGLVLNQALDGPLPPSASAAERERAVGAAAWGFEHGTLLAVYTFLEDLGVRWRYPGDGGTLIPARATLLIPQQERELRSPFTVRQAGGVIPATDEAAYRQVWGDERRQRLWELRLRATSGAPVAEFFCYEGEAGTPPTDVLLGLCPAPAASLSPWLAVGPWQEQLSLADRAVRVVGRPISYHATWQRPAELPALPYYFPRRAASIARNLAPYCDAFRLTAEPGNPVADALTRALLLRQLWQPDAKPEPLLAALYADWFGPAAKPMTALLDRFEARSEAVADDRPPEERLWRKLYSAQALAADQELLAEARELAAGTPYAAAIDLVDHHWLQPLAEQRRQAAPEE
jgi:hypothetical protein